MLSVFLIAIIFIRILISLLRLFKFKITIRLIPNLVSRNFFISADTGFNRVFLQSVQNALGVYCNGVKCSPGENCELDRKTNKNVCRGAWKG